MFTGQLGGAGSQLGNVVLGGTPFSVLPFGFTPHVLDSATIRVQFADQVDDSALNPAAYSMLAVGGPPPRFIPTVVSVTFYDADHRSVALVLNQPLTFTATYALSIVGVTSPDGNSVTPSAGNFRANVPNPPLALGAYQSQRAMVDIYFDRPVGPTSPGSAADIQATTGGTPQAMTRIPWSSALPTNVLRFELPPSMDVASSYIITYSNVIDGSNNQAPGQVPLTLVLQAPQPYNYTVLSTPQIIDAWVSAISNAPSGYNRAFIDVYFNSTMSHADIVNVANWTVTSAGNPVTVLEVFDWSSALDSRAFPAVDGRTFFARVVVSATSSAAPYFVQAQVRSEDLARTTNPADYTGNISVAPLATAPRVVGSLVSPMQASFRFDQGIALPSVLRVAGTNGSTATSSVQVVPSIQALVTCLNDLMQSYNQHITTPYGAGHLVPDTVNYFLPVDFPLATLAAGIAAVNRFRDIYYYHASSRVFHHYPDPDLVQSPYATDLPSALALAQELIQSFVAHNVNVGVHNIAGAQLFSSKIVDTLSIGLGMLQGTSYTLSIQSQYLFTDVGENSVPMRFTSSIPFSGVATPPYVASAIPRPGLQETNTGLRFESDAVLVFFSKPIRPAVLTPTDIVITGPTTIVTQGYQWENNRLLSIGVINMATAQYALDIFGVQDLFGNAIVSA